MHASLNRWFKAAAVALAFVTAGAVHAAGTTNYSDQWGNFSENGWGISVLQQDEVLFIDMFVYGADNKATWFVVGAEFKNFTAAGHLIFSGDLYAGTGPYYGAAVFNPAQVVGVKVGTFTFDSDTVNTATITYNVGGITVTKNVQRTFWATEKFAGKYQGGLVFDASGCATAANGHFEELGPLTITQGTGDNATLTLLSTPTNVAGTCSYVGTYTQSGHMGGASGTYSCSGGDNGTFTFFEMEKSISGMTGRFTSQAGTCVLDGRFGGVLLQSAP